MAVKVTKDEVLHYHEHPTPGKIEVVPTKPTATQRDLSLAYTPGVAIPCKEIERDPELAYRYTRKGNLVGVITNGTAVLGLGDIGALSGKPVMEGKALLFKKFADIDVFDIEIAEKDPQKVIQVVEALAPTFGGINLEDIKAPECFVIEDALKAKLDIPVFHDDQHGTAIISGAALLNALEIQGKDMAKVRIVMTGAGAASIACARMYVQLGAQKDHITMCDRAGVVYRGRTENMNRWKEEFAAPTQARSVADALKGADVFVGLSGPGIVQPAMLKGMAPKPVIFAMANPDPEISYDDAKRARPDAVVATGRSDFPNQVNNVLGYPFIFRGALDTRAKAINEPMKVAATRALAALAREDVPDEVINAYGGTPLKFGPEYIIPKPFDHRVLLWVAPAVAKAAMDTGVARVPLDLDKYRDALEARLGKSMEMMRVIFNKAKRAPKRIVYPEGDNEKILRAAQIVADEGFAHPILVGDGQLIRSRLKEMGLDVKPTILDLRTDPRMEEFAERLVQLRGRKGITITEAREMMRQPNYFAAMLVERGEADGFIGGLTTHYPDTLRPCLHVIGTSPDSKRVVGLYMMTIKKKVFFFADATVNIEPSAEDLAEIAIQAARVAQRFDVPPKVAMLSFSNFGSARHPAAEKVAQAVRIVRQRAPDLEVDGELQADTAVVPELLAEYPFAKLTDAANVLVFPDLEAANIAYKLLQRLGDAEATGPILEGMAKPVHVLQRGDEVSDVVNMTAIAVVEAQETSQGR
ncbi:MAG TPA: NADP-dependent malic enzyme [Candidatus Thermoplasmatota archaeon]|jgi:malate dehydrogenase (oxaloacetate-decarboxylating)(NADP+)|nr:NADP-dependent malic enzyme [Candidatus Thermoplasmatota archaeon]